MSEVEGLEKRTVVAMRKCGHYLHHTAGAKAGISEEALLAVLSKEEKETLCLLLEKCLQDWNGQN